MILKQAREPGGMSDLPKHGCKSLTSGPRSRSQKWHVVCLYKGSRGQGGPRAGVGVGIHIGATMWKFLITLFLTATVAAELPAQTRGKALSFPAGVDLVNLNVS